MSSQQSPLLDRRPSESAESSTSGISFKDRFSRALSPNRASLVNERRTSFGKTLSNMDERGRQPIVSTGRGGAGNLVRSPSRGVDPDVRRGEERGREPRDDSATREKVIHSGRGGAGNIRSPSREPRDRMAEVKEDQLQAKLIAEERGREAEGAVSSGRGGAGNIRGRSKSRSRSAVRGVDSRTPDGHNPHASGRGGWGNINEEHERDSLDEEKLAAQDKHDAQIRAQHDASEASKPYLSGRGGGGNVHTDHGQAGRAETEEEKAEKAAHAKVHAHDRGRGVNTGRGGAGNIRRDGSNDVDGERGRDKPNGHGGVFGSVLRSLSRAARGDKSSDRSTERAKD